jgi:C-terminal processing protease CtpA/Prc
VDKLIWSDPVVETGTGFSTDKTNLLGNDFLQRFRVLVDFKNLKLYLTPDAVFTEDASKWIGMGIGIGFADTIVIVTDLYTLSPASQAGIKVDDEIVSVNGVLRTRTAEERAKVFTQLPKKIGEEVTLRVRSSKSEKPRLVKLKVAKLL